MKIATGVLAVSLLSSAAHAAVFRTQCEANLPNEPSYRYEVTLDTKNGVGSLWVFDNGVHNGYLATLRIRDVQSGSALTRITYQNINATGTVQDIYVRSDGQGDTSNQREYVVSHKVPANDAARQFFNPTGPGTANDSMRAWMQDQRRGEDVHHADSALHNQTAEEARATGAVVDSCGLGE